MFSSVGLAAVGQGRGWAGLGSWRYGRWWCGFGPVWVSRQYGGRWGSGLLVGVGWSGDRVGSVVGHFGYDGCCWTLMTMYEVFSSLVACDVDDRILFGI